MNAKRLFLACSFIALLGGSIQSKAEDIDLYSTAGVAALADLPNVLFVMDTGANFDAAIPNSMPECTYSDGTGSPSLGSNKAAGIEQCALVDALNKLPFKANGDAVVNVGIMIYNTGKNGCNASGDGGCVLYQLTPMSRSARDTMVGLIKQWDINNIKSNTGKTGAVMQEAWAFFAGKTGMSGTTYPTTRLSGCQKNYVLYLANAAVASSTPGDGGSGSPGASLATAISNNTALTASQKTMLNGTIQIPSGTYGTSTFNCTTRYTMPSPHDSKGLYADEWARYMHDVDLKLGSMPSNRKIVTYTIGVLSDDCSGEYPALLTSMALRGGGKYFATSNSAEIATAILRVLNEVQAVNSVFSSSSLPVSVNTQGTYLNQIFMGMFRPDAGGTPRWMGNLKQYQFSYDATTQNLFLSDATGTDAISGAGTGFLSPDAASFWTCGNATRDGSPTLVPPYDGLAKCNSDPAGGFWGNSSSGAGGTYDLPDGEVVEKGGAAQMLRLANFYDDYTAAPGSTTNPRKLYTYCPGGTCTYPNDCTAAPTDPSCQLSNTANVIDPSNAAITDVKLGTGPRAISSITSAPTVTPASTVAVAHPAGVSTTPASITILSFSKSGSAVTATVSAADFGLISPTSRVTVTNVSSKVNCTSCAITSTNSTTHTFTYTSGPGNLTSQSFSATISDPFLSAPYSVVTVNTSSNHGLSPGQRITFASTTSTTPCTVLTALNNTIHTITSATTASPYSFSITLASSTLSGTDSACKYSPNTAIVTATDHGFANGSVVTIAGATPAGYNGTWTVAVTGPDNFTYQYTDPAPLASFFGSGATATSSSTTRDNLIRWVRGEDNYGDEASLCPPGIAAGEGQCPTPRITIRPSVHGDVLHSRPVVLNYGGTNGVIVFYGGNDGVFRAVNGNQVNPASSTLPSPGRELWGFIPEDFLPQLVRQHDNSPVLLMPSTFPGIIPPPKKKDYFVDGSTGVFQVIDGDGITTKAYIYLAMRRGGRMIYALSVGPDPSNPVFLWKHSNAEADFAELGQTWSQPKVAMVNGYNNVDGTPKPVLIFGAGYDANAEDAEAPTADGMGRGIFILDANDGHLIWSAGPSAGATACSGTTTLASCQVAGMNYSIPSDITLVDRNSDGRIDRLYVGDMGGNLWRVDLGNPTSLHNVNSTGGICSSTAPAECTPDLWHVEKLAALGCPTGTCPSGTPPRKIFYPPEMITAGTYDAVFVATGDREHPLYTTTAIDITSTADSTNRTATASATDVAKIGAVDATNSVTFANGDTCTVTVASANTFTYSKTGCGASGAQNAQVISTQSACFVTNRAYLLKDTGTSLNDASPKTALTEANLRNATSTPYDNTLSGYYITFQTCEKSVNAPLVVAGYIYFGTNRAKAPENETCEETLGEATGYRLSPFTGKYTSGEFEGGGLPPSPVSGIVNIDQGGQTIQVPFCIGCGGEEDENGGNPCASDSALAGCRPPINVTTDRSRTYWYIKGK